jgi:hypothetical protein
MSETSFVSILAEGGQIFVVRESIAKGAGMWKDALADDFAEKATKTIVAPFPFVALCVF